MPEELIAIDQEDLFPIDTGKESIFQFIANRQQTPQNRILRNLTELQTRFPDLGYRIVKEGGDVIETISGRQQRPVRYFARASNSQFSTTDSPPATPRNGLFSVNVPGASEDSWSLRDYRSADAPPAIPKPRFTAVSIPGASMDSWAAPAIARTNALIEASVPAAPVAEEPILGFRGRTDQSPLLQITDRVPVDVPSPRPKFDISAWVPRQRVVYPNVLPGIFESLREQEKGATQLTGFDPQNPPSAHTITKAQFKTLNAIQRQHYLAETDRRHQVIESMKARQRSLSNLAMQDFVAERSDIRRADLRTGDEDNAQRIATEDYQTALKNKSLTDTAFEQARQLDKSFKKALSEAKSLKMVREERDGTIIPTHFGVDNKVSDVSVNLAKKLNSDRIDIDDQIERMTIAKNESDRVFNETSRTAGIRKQSRTTPANGQKVMVIDAQGNRGLIPAEKVPLALKRGASLVQ